MTRNKLHIIGVTGNSGSGKSTVSEMLRNRGAVVFDADTMAHAVMEPGGRAYDEIIGSFGRGILRADMTIDRAALGDIVFRDGEKKKLLEAIVHKYVVMETIEATEKLRDLPQPPRLVVWDAPLLIEAKMHSNCDSVWVVVSDMDRKISRTVERDGIDIGKARLRLGNQTSEEELVKYAAEIIENNGDIEELEKRVDGLCGKILAAGDGSISCSLDLYNLS